MIYFSQLAEMLTWFECLTPIRGSQWVPSSLSQSMPLFHSSTARPVSRRSVSLSTQNTRFKKPLHRYQGSLYFLKVSVRIKFLFCNILPLSICISKEVQEICAKPLKFETNIYIRSKFSRVRSSHDLCAHTHAHSIGGTLTCYSVN